MMRIEPRRRRPIREILSTHHRSLIDNRSGSHFRVWRSYMPATAVAVALLLGKLFACSHLNLSGAGRVLLQASALLSGVLFGVCITMLSKAIDLDISAPAESPEVTRSAERLQALAANALYSVLLAGLATGLLVAGELLSVIRPYTTIIAVALLVQVGTNGVIVASRVFLDTQWRSDRASAGISHAERR